MIALLLAADLVTASVRTTVYENAGDEIKLTDVESIVRTFKREPTQWQVEESRTFRYSLMDGQKVPGDFKAVVTKSQFPLTEPPLTIDPANGRILRIYSALFLARDQNFEAQIGGLGEGKVQFGPAKLPRTFTYQDPEFRGEGTVSWDPKTQLPTTWRFTAKNVAIPGGDSRADLTIDEKPEPK